MERDMEISKTISSFLLLVGVFMGLMASSGAYDFYVGGRDGWVPNPSESYGNWAGRNRFQVNDTLVFKYGKGVDSVLVVTKQDYDACNVSNPIQKLEGGDSVFKLDRSGPFFFISGVPENCQKGQKLLVVVLAVRNKNPTPSPPSPPPVTPPSPSPPLMSPTSSPASSPSVSPLASSPSPSPASNSRSPSPSPSPTSPAHSPSPGPSAHSPVSTPSPNPSPSLTPLPSTASPAPPPASASTGTEPTPPPSPPSPSSSFIAGASSSITLGLMAMILGGAFLR